MKKSILAIATTPFFIVKGSSLRVKSSMEILTKRYKVDLITYPIGDDVKIRDLKIDRVKAPFSKTLKVSRVSLYRIFLDIEILFKALILLSRRKDYIAIHCEDFEAALVGSICKIFNNKIKLIYNMHNSIIDNFAINNIKGVITTFVKPIEGFVLASSDLIILNWRRYKNYRNIPDKLNFLYYDSVETKEQAIGLKLPKRFIVYAGNYEKYQGVREFLSVYAKNSIKTKLILVGEISKEISVTLKDLHLENKVMVIGKLPIRQTNYILKRALLCLSPRTLGDQPGLKTIHHLLIGKATLGTHSIPNLEVLKNMENSILYRNNKELAGILKKLDRNAIDLERLNRSLKKSRSNLLRILSHQYFLKHYEKVFNE